MPTEEKTRTGRKRKIVSTIVLIINLAFIFSLLISYLSAYISPEYIWWMELFSLAYGILVGINIFFIILWLVLRKRYFLYSLIAVLIGFGRIFNIVQFSFAETSMAAPASVSEHPWLKVMTYNVHVFDLYNYKENHPLRYKMFDMLEKDSPDIVCFQEFFSSTYTGKNRFENADTLKKIMSAPYAHIAYTLTLHEWDHWGIATYSKYPIINKQEVPFGKPGENIFIYTDIVAGSDTFRVFNVHLESDRFEPADYRFVKDFDIGKNEESQVKGFWKRVANIVKRLKHSAAKRAQQTPLMQQYIAESPYPVIVCGDFNDTPSSYTYHSLSRNLKDSFRESGTGFGNTYIGAFPSFRIDYILHDKKIQSTGYKTGTEEYSDHYTISCFVQKK